MNRIVGKVSSLTYQKIIKPLLFRRQPDEVHFSLLRLGSRAQKYTLARNLASGMWAYKNPVRLSQKLHGVTFENPIGLSAGFDKNFNLPPLMKAIGFGFMEGGSITLEPCAGNPRPWFYRLPKTKSIIVHVGLANEGTEEIIRRIKRYPAKTLRSFPLNISVAKTNSPRVCSEKDAIADYVGSLWLIKRTRVGGLVTINISCPNTYGGEPFSEQGKLERLLSQVDKVGLRQPVFIKMPIDLPWPEFKKMLDVAARHKVAGVTIGNLAKDRSKIKLKDPLPSDFAGGLSGKPTWELSNDLIHRTYIEYGQRFTIIGVGGVFSAEDAYTKIRLGASLVELITGMIFEGPQLIGQINRGLVKLLERDGYQRISEAVGVDVHSKPRYQR